MIELTIAQTDLLFEATEIYELWYSKYYIQPPSFAELLKMNHIKLMDLFTDEPTEIEVTEAILKIKESYFKLLADY